MNDAQVKQQINQMVSFIRQEADEKANEIRVKAEEDFNIRKLSAVEAAREKIRAEYERKSKNIEIEQKIAYSTALNESRLKVLKVKEEIMREIYDEAHEKLKKRMSNEETCKSTLKELALQGVLALRDKTVSIVTKEEHRDVMKKLLKDVSKEFKDATGKDVELSVSEKDSLSKDSVGGVRLLSEGGRIKLENTMESRLDIAYQHNLPYLRSILQFDEE